MKRGGPLQRKTRLRHGKPLQSRAQLATVTPMPQRGTALRARSKKMAAIYRDQRVPLVSASLEQSPWCAIRWDANCTQRADSLHELLPRGRGGSITDEANTVPACNYCNGAVADNPAEAGRRGFLLPSGRPVKAVPRPQAPAEVTS